MTCPKCQAEVTGGGRFCRSCGAPLQAETAAPACPSCGAAVKPGAKFCASCAAPLSAAAEAVRTAGTLCPACGAELKEGAKFCKSCGTSMVAGPARSEALEAPRPAVVPQPPPPPVVPSRTSPVAAAEAATQLDLNPPPPPARVAPPTQGPRVVQAAPVAPQPARLEAAQAPPAAPRSASPAPAGSQQGGNKSLLIGAIAALVLLALGATYWIVLRKPAAQQAATPAQAPASYPAGDTTAQTTPGTTEAPADAESIIAASSDQPAETPAAADSAGAPSSSTPTSSAAATPKIPKPTAAKPARTAYSQAHDNADKALVARQYLEPENNSAVFWARKAKAQGDPTAAMIEQQVFSNVMSEINASRAAHNYDQARAQVYQLATGFPDRPEIRQLQDDIRQEQQSHTQQLEQQRRQAELAAKTKKFPVQHRHGMGNSFCTGMITVNPDGTARYDCSTADGNGRCEHVVFETGSLKEAKIRGDGSLHVATKKSGNYDFAGADGNLRDAAAALGPLVSR